jgi:hypothetical protein
MEWSTSCEGTCDHLHVLGDGDVKLEHFGRGGEVLGHPLGQGKPSASTRQHYLGAFFFGELSDPVGDRVVGEHARDQEPLAGQESHGSLG